ncbi:DUF2970 domain-containing protein [Arhodomonas sp. AD133]|uniref:DUF2970 domain-containing protein n=1 Tax=Arhodomonas sp. AD133 TaxID=3415009 RepID=UPI003EBF1E7A
MASKRRSGESVGLVDTALSVLAAFFGVQSQRNRERDFTRGNPAVFIGVASVMTVAVVLVLVLAVRLALTVAGA